MTNPLHEILRHLRGSVSRSAAERTDGELLECFVSRREQAALEALVRRHGPMVWGVCQRILRDSHDAEDAFQATFLVLIRRASCIVPREKVADWLHGVAQQTALKARAMRAKRRTRERHVTEMPEPEARPHEPLNEWQSLLDAEIRRLPDKYRAVFLLCELEDKSRKEAARQLGLAEGTVASRLARAKAKLAKRLVRHGPTVAMLPACPHDALLSSTIHAVRDYAAGQAMAAGAISTKAAALTEEMLRSMMMTRFKMVVLAGVLALPLCGITGAAVGLGRDELEPPKKQIDKPVLIKKEVEKPAKESKRPDGIAAIRKARIELARKGYDLAVETINATKRSGNTLIYIGKPEDVYTWSVRLLQAERETKSKRAEQIVALEAHLKRMIKLQEKVKALTLDLIPASENLHAEWHRLEAELWLVEAQSKSK